MRRTILAAAVSVAPLALFAGPVRAQPPAGAAGVWAVRSVAGQCSAEASYGPNVRMRLTRGAVGASAELYVWNRSWGWVSQGESYDVSLRFSNGGTHRGSAVRGVRLASRGNEPVNGLWIRVDSSEFLDDFARAATVDVTADGRPLGTLSLRGTSAAVQSLEECALAVASGLPRAPLAPASSRPAPGAAIAVPPVHRVGTMTDDDYPAAAIRAEEQGTVTIEMAVSAEGFVTDCVILASSGSAILDTTTCAIARRRFRFTPAMDVNGRPLAATATRTVAWRLPEVVVPPPPKG
jgi:TonB family protein